jgi:hypothetical protein
MYFLNKKITQVLLYAPDSSQDFQSIRPRRFRAVDSVVSTAEGEASVVVVMMLSRRQLNTTIFEYQAYYEPRYS